MRGVRIACAPKESQCSTGNEKRANGHVDYMFMGGVEDEGTKCTIKDRDTRMVMSSVVPLEGASHEFPARRVRSFINELTWLRTHQNRLEV